MSAVELLLIPAELAGQTLAAFVRRFLPGQSWRQVRQHIAARRVRLNGEVCLDPARRLKEADRIELLAESAPKPRQPDAVVIRYLDEHVVVVEKPSGISTVRHPSERAWPQQRKALSPTLQDLVPPLIAQREGRVRKGPLPRLRIVHRIDKETSGLVVFARSVLAEQALGRQFKKHTVVRRYLAIVPGYLAPQRIASHLVRDRGDGRRGSTPPFAPPSQGGERGGVGKHAVTHVEVVERLAGYTLLSVRLETGRTHQIRIHLAEEGHPICGEKVYNRSVGAAAIPDGSGAPRLALHATELGFVHPVSGKSLDWTMPLPADLQTFLDRLRS